MKIFISWSGERSKEVAKVLKKFIKDIIASVEVFVSFEDISLGKEWLSKIKNGIRGSDYGIIIMTKDNKENPWLIFETGALWNSSEEIPVVPFLLDLTPSDLSESPVRNLQQAKIYDGKDDVYRLIKEIHDSCGNNVSEENLKIIFDKKYDNFEKTLSEIKEKNYDKITPEKPPTVTVDVLDKKFEKMQNLLLEQFKSFSNHNSENKQSDSKEKSLINYLFDLAYKYLNEENYTLAEELYNKIIELCDKNSFNFIRANWFLGFIYRRKKEYNKALDYYLKALKIYKKEFGKSDDNVINIYDNIALTYDLMGDTENTEKYYKLADEADKLQNESTV